MRRRHGLWPNPALSQHENRQRMHILQPGDDLDRFFAHVATAARRAPLLDDESRAPVNGAIL